MFWRMCAVCGDGFMQQNVDYAWCSIRYISIQIYHAKIQHWKIMAKRRERNRESEIEWFLFDLCESVVGVVGGKVVRETVIYL